MKQDTVYDWEEISSNKHWFSDVMERCEEEEDNVVVWICNFCEKKNVIECSELKFARNNSRVVVKQGCTIASLSKKKSKKGSNPLDCVRHQWLHG